MALYAEVGMTVGADRHRVVFLLRGDTHKSHGLLGLRHVRSGHGRHVGTPKHPPRAPTDCRQLVKHPAVASDRMEGRLTSHHCHGPSLVANRCQPFGSKRGLCKSIS